ncbi:YciI family protein [Curtobacterium sp. TC1]|uniref:YciI family protein n=1 Tax=Curtobacterium sp. TC1 TaxID=2862880 RepID=UPI001C9B1454|nr:YciI family protein [Curtobacterium sp. TC1]QZQ57443.1 YciI family protein [Curtobacterium sp. TC1]
MQFLVNVIDDGQAEAAGRTESATQAEAAAVDALNQRLGDAVVFAAGVSAPADGTVVDARGGDSDTTPGLVADAPGFVAGFWVMELPDAETALRVAHEASQACNRKIELRPLL